LGGFSKWLRNQVSARIRRVIVLQKPTANTAASIVKKLRKAGWLRLVAAVAIDPAIPKFLISPYKLPHAILPLAGIGVNKSLKRRLDEDYRAACRFKSLYDRGLVWSPETSERSTNFCNHI